MKVVYGEDSAGKVMLTAFWEVNGVNHSELMLLTTLLNSER
jgi:hypothetical protein